MQFSIITPTHNTQYLVELYDSILEQTYNNREWVVVLNNWVREDDIDAGRSKQLVLKHQAQCLGREVLGCLD